MLRARCWVASFVLGVVWCQKAQNDGSLLQRWNPLPWVPLLYVKAVFVVLECRSVKKKSGNDEFYSGYGGKFGKGWLDGTLFWGLCYGIFP